MTCTTARSLVGSLLLLHLFAALASGQATRSSMVATNLGQGFMIDIPGDWTITGRGVLNQAFAQRSSAYLSDVLHLKDARPTDLPYATVEQIGYRGMTSPTATQQQQLAQMVADYYATAFSPPSKADRPPLFKSATVSPVVYDASNRRFTFSVVVKYDLIGEQHVDVAGCFGTTLFVVTSIWTDGDYYDANRPALIAMRDSLRLGSPPARDAAGAAFKRTAQVVTGVVVLALVGVQVMVVLKQPRERRAEAQRLLSGN